MARFNAYSSMAASRLAADDNMINNEVIADQAVQARPADMQFLARSQRILIRRGM